MTISLFVYLSLNEMKEGFVVVKNLNLRLMRPLEIVYRRKENNNDSKVHGNTSDTSDNSQIGCLITILTT